MEKSKIQASINPLNSGGYEDLTSKVLIEENFRRSDKHLNMNEIVSLAWGAKEILRGDYKQSKYGDIILPFVVLRRLERVLEPSKEKILEELENIKNMDEKLIDARLNQISRHQFHNQSKYNLELLLADPNNIHKNLKRYLRDFSPTVRDIFDNFKFETTIDDLQKQKLLYKIVQHFAKPLLDPQTIDNHMMGTIYEELIRRTSEAANEEAGDHFTPREVIKLMVNLLFSHDKEFLKQKHLIRTIYDPAAGTGGMLSVASEYIREINPDAKLDAFGQELNPESYAVCKSDMLLKGLDLNRIKKGNSLTDEDGFLNQRFHYMLSNPPFGVDWEKYEDKINVEKEKGIEGKYGAGVPRKSDGSLLFLLHMISKMKEVEHGGSRIAIVLNGSPLFTGEAGSGESNIRRYIIENDMLEALIALPDHLFYNTGIFTYIWIVTNNKEPKRRGKVQLINAISYYEKMKSNLGEKSKYISKDQIDQITRIYESYKEEEVCKVFENNDFGYTRIITERPLRCNYEVNNERLNNLSQRNILLKQDNKNIKQNQLTHDNLIKILKTMPTKLYKNRVEFLTDLNNKFSVAKCTLTPPILKAIESVLGEHDETAEIVVDKNGKPIPDNDLRDYENIPLKQDIDTYFKNEVLPYVPDAWIDDSTRKNIGYEITFTKYFYKYKPIRSLVEIDNEIKILEHEILKEVGKLK